ncbi:hypothetical protein GEMRC1_010979 [Eukaryota sp. GEM-RC1]
MEVRCSFTLEHSSSSSVSPSFRGFKPPPSTSIVLTRDLKIPNILFSHEFSSPLLSLFYCPKTDLFTVTTEDQGVHLLTTTLQPIMELPSTDALLSIQLYDSIFALLKSNALVFSTITDSSSSVISSVDVSADDYSVDCIDDVIVAQGNDHVILIGLEQGVPSKSIVLSNKGKRLSIGGISRKGSKLIGYAICDGQWIEDTQSEGIVLSHLSVPLQLLFTNIDEGVEVNVIPEVKVEEEVEQEPQVKQNQDVSSETDVKVEEPEEEVSQISEEVPRLVVEELKVEEDDEKTPRVQFGTPGVEEMFKVEEQVLKLNVEESPKAEESPQASFGEPEAQVEEEFKVELPIDVEETAESKLMIETLHQRLQQTLPALIESAVIKSVNKGLPSALKSSLKPATSIEHSLSQSATNSATLSRQLRSEINALNTTLKAFNASIQTTTSKFENLVKGRVSAIVNDAANQFKSSLHGVCLESFTTFLSEQLVPALNETLRDQLVGLSTVVGKSQASLMEELKYDTGYGSELHESVGLLSKEFEGLRGQVLKLQSNEQKVDSKMMAQIVDQIQILGDKIESLQRTGISVKLCPQDPTLLSFLSQQDYPQALDYILSQESLETAASLMESILLMEDIKPKVVVRMLDLDTVGHLLRLLTCMLPGTVMTKQVLNYVVNCVAKCGTHGELTEEFKNDVEALNQVVSSLERSSEVDQVLYWINNLL